MYTTYLMAFLAFFSQCLALPWDQRLEHLPSHDPRHFLADTFRLLSPITCEFRPSPPDRWACQSPELEFPTVDCIRKDLLICGNGMLRNPLFWSFGATVEDYRDFMSSLRLGFVNYNLILGPEWFWDVFANPNFAVIPGTPRFDLLVSRISMAWASICRGVAYLVVKQRNGTANFNPRGDPGIGGPKGQGAYQYSFPGLTSRSGYKQYNKWRVFEFPALQRNENISSVITADVSKDFERRRDWRFGNNNFLLPILNPDQVPVPPFNDTWIY